VRRNRKETETGKAVARDPKGLAKTSSIQTPSGKNAVVFDKG